MLYLVEHPLRMNLDIGIQIDRKNSLLSFGYAAGVSHI
jgi:hypothetical protein